MTDADERRSRSDEAVRRIREESRRRIEQWRGWRAFSSLCALASLVGGVSLAVMNAREARQLRQAEDAAAEVAKAERSAGEADAAEAAKAAPAVLEGALAAATAVRNRLHQEMCEEMLAESRRLRWTLAVQLASARGEKQRARIWAEMQERHAPLARAQAEEGCPVTSLEQPRCRCGDC